MDDLEGWLAFRRHETAPCPTLTCCECNGPAEGNASFEDGGQICDKCIAASDALLAAEERTLQDLHNFALEQEATVV